jgi:hypothetical protein
LGVKDEEQNGLIVLDECASWLNSRDYNDPGRKPMFDWFLHSRKHGWDVLYLIQDWEALDKQFRQSFMEYRVPVWRLDRFPIPLIGWIIRLFFSTARVLPKVHIARFFYGGLKIPTYSKWALGRLYYKAYDTEQKFTEANGIGLHSQLSAWHVRSRYQTRWQMYKGVMFSSFLVGCFCAFLLTASIGKLMGYARPASPSEVALPVEADSEIVGFFREGPLLIFTTKDGRQLSSRTFLETSAGYRALVAGKWYSQPGAAK